MLWGGFQHWLDLQFPLEVKKYSKVERKGLPFGPVPRLELLVEPQDVVKYLQENHLVPANQLQYLN